MKMTLTVIGSKVAEKRRFTVIGRVSTPMRIRCSWIIDILEAKRRNT